MGALNRGWVWASLAGGGLVGAGVLAQRHFQRQIAEDPEQEVLNAPLDGRELRFLSADGTSLHAKVFGPDDAPPIVLAHGWTENLGFWIYQIRELTPRGFRVVAYDLRGHGDSAPAVDGDYSIDRFGEDLEAVLSSCVRDGERAVIAGHSLGAMSIAAWAKDHDVERRVGAAAMINTGVGDLVADQVLLPVPKVAQALNQTLAVHGFLGARAPLPRFSTPVTAAALRYIVFGPAATPAQVAFFERMVIASPPDVRADVGLAISKIALYDDLPKLTVPTIVVAGEADRLTPPDHARRIAERLPQLEELIILPETGHMAPLERHRKISDVLIKLADKAAHPGGVVSA
jgi:pimeloyl-ACP methyl ester carboxylesterase